MNVGSTRSRAGRLAQLCQPERVAALEKLLAEHDTQQAEPLWPSAVLTPINIDKTLLEADEPDDEYIYWSN